MNTRSWKSFSSVALFAVALGTVAGCAAGGEPSTTTEPEIVAPPAVTPPVVTPEAPKNPTGSGQTVSAKIDNSTGGAVALPDGTTVVVPAGALPAGVDTITVTSAPEAAPAEYTASSPLFVFGPDGTVFLKPLAISMPVTFPAGESASDLTILWSRANADGFDIVPTTFAPVAGSSSSYIASAEVTHFSKGFCGLKFKADPHPKKDPYADK